VLARWRPILVYSVVEIAVPWLLLFDAEKKLSSSLAGLLIAAVPLVAAVLASVTGSADRLDRRRLFGVLLGLAGVAALVGFDVGRSDLLAAASLGVVAIGYALGPWILSRHLSDMPALGVVTCSLVVCAVVYAPIAAFSLPTRSLSWQVASSAVALTVVCTVAAFLIFFALISEVGPARSTVITYVNPAVAVLLGTTVLGERFGVGTAVGFALIVGGCVFATARTSRLAEPAESGGLVASGEAAALEAD
jgi:drug/metabolite transporter (DMT)-like permease